MLMRWVISILLNAVALIAVAQIFEGFYLEGFGTAILASFILSIINVIVKPILIFFTLPITFITFGLFLFIINAITLMITQALFSSSFVFEGFGTAIIASVVISIITMLLNNLVKDTMR